MPPRKLQVRDRVLVWFAFLGGAAAWSLDLVVGYGLEEALCPSGLVEPLALGLTAVTGAGALAALAAAVRLRRRARDGVLDDPRRRLEFMGSWGILAGLLFAAMIALGGVQLLALDSCTPG